MQLEYIRMQHPFMHDHYASYHDRIIVQAVEASEQLENACKKTLSFARITFT